ncbi:MAG: YihY/virulence factor BrkB family protein [Erysipelotrichaceae bacterium]|nr:YihY/virulence factor BrkB family protein [Erysipelotrichaceae bacterium]
MGKLKYYIKRAFETFNQMEMRVLPGNIAFFFVLALIPMITIVVIVASYFSVSVDTIIQFVREVIPGEAGNLIVEVISGKGFDSSVGAFNIIALFVASNGTYAIINASNTLYQVHHSDTLKDRIKAILLLIILLFLIVFLIVVPMFGEKIISLFGDGKIVEKIRIIYQIARWPSTFFLIYVNLKLIYTIAPSKLIPSRSTTYGALFTTVIWTIATAIFSYYLKYFANYNVIYGNLSNIIILMMWLYIISYVFVMGIAINVTNLDEN